MLARPNCEPTTHRRLFASPDRQVIVEIGGGLGTSSCNSVPYLAASGVYKVLRDNRQRSHHGGHHGRRIHGASTRHQSAPCRPACPVHLLGLGPCQGLVSQVVAPLSRSWTRRSLRPDPSQPPRRSAHFARTGEDNPVHPAPAPGPCHAGQPLPPYRCFGPVSRTQGSRHPAAAPPAHHRARAPA